MVLRHRFTFARGIVAVGFSARADVAVHAASAAMPCDDQMPSDQTPSLALSRSLTACGFALPPDAFITWPTNQPSIAGLALACSDLVGIGGDDVVDQLLDRAGVGDLLHAARLDDGARVAALGPHDLEQVLGDLARDGAFAIRSRMAPSCAAETGEAAISLPSRLSRPNSSLITQLAATLASRRCRPGAPTTASK